MTGESWLTLVLLAGLTLLWLVVLPRAGIG